MCHFTKLLAYDRSRPPDRLVAHPLSFRKLSLFVVSDFCSRRATQNLTEMFPREDILRCTLFAAIGGIIAVVALQLWEKSKETGAQRDIRGGNNLNEPPRKEPQENDERFC